MQHRTEMSKKKPIPLSVKKLAAARASGHPSIDVMTEESDAKFRGKLLLSFKIEFWVPMK